MLFRDMVKLIGGRIVPAKRLSALALLLALGACASGATPGAMTVPLSEQTMLAEGSRLRQSVQVGSINGGRDTNPLWTSQVSDADFATALRQSLGTHAMLSINNQLFRVDAQMVGLDQPLAGLDLEVRSRVRYRVTQVATGATVLDQEIAAAYTAPFSASFLAIERLRLANEGSIRENIRQFLVALIAAERSNPAAFGAPARIS
jgi:hypothetical protein